MKKLKIQMAGRTDEFQTPEYAIEHLLPYLDKKKVIWECAWGGGSLAKHLRKKGFKVIGKKNIDFLKDKPLKCDMIITNPPYSKKDEFVEKCYALGKPFALLMPLTALEGQKRQRYYRTYGLQVIIPNRRINFITPSGKGGGSWFMTAWFTNGLKLKNQLNFVEIANNKSS